MAKRMLIDATHPEEMRVVVLNGNRLEEFDFETSTKKQVKGNIYLAKVTRVEPSLQAAFVEYGGNRHGFLAFSEIHPDYYRIPIADRRGIGADPQQPDLAAVDDSGEAADEGGVPLEEALPEPVAVVEIGSSHDDPADIEPLAEPEDDTADDDSPGPTVEAEPRSDLSWEEPWSVAPAISEPPATGQAVAGFPETGAVPEGPVRPEEPVDSGEPAENTFEVDEEAIALRSAPIAGWAAASAGDEVVVAPEAALTGSDMVGEASEALGAAEALTATDGEGGESEIIETLGGDEFEEVESQRSRAHRHYKIQEVIKRRQIMLVQVTKEERGNKGAALTTYLSLAGRYCVLMPNTARGGGVSRKITNLGDRRRLKEILEELEIPEGMGVIVRTAGAERSKAEIKRDYEYLLRLWNEIRELTLRSTAPALIYEEGDLIKRSIRDLYTRDIDEVLIEGEEGYRTAKAFMKMLMPSHAKRVQPYRDPQIGLLHRFQVESQIDAIHSPVVQLRSGGYVVIDQTEALVAIDVNSGRSTRERNIEETALRTNLEAAEEIARQLRLRDLAGLIVIDFIDMEEHRNQGAVERRLKDALKSDRARIQVGRISPFGLLEMSRQRLRSSLVEASTQPCPHCGGTGFIRSTESTALHVLRSIEEEGIRRRSAEVCVYVPTTVALYILNHKRDLLAQLETRYGIRVLVARDDALIPPAFRLERLRAIEPGETTAPVPAPLTQAPEIETDEAEDDFDEVVEADDAEPPELDGEDERGRARRRRRRRRRHEDERSRAPSSASGEEADEAPAARVAVSAMGEADREREGEDDGEAERLRRRRGRRGGRRRGRREETMGPGVEIGRAAVDSVEIVALGADGVRDAFENDEMEPAAADSVEIVATGADGVGDDAFENHETAPAPRFAATEIEAASLPAFAGDGMPAEAVAPEPTAPEAVSPEPNAPEPTAPEPTAPFAAFEIEAVSLPAAAGDGALAEHPAPAGAPADLSPEIAAAPDQMTAYSAPNETVRGNGAAVADGPNPPLEPLAVEPGNGIGFAARPNEAAVAAIGSAPEAEPAFEPRPAAAVEPAPRSESDPAHLVQEVTKKPENPRRGWWQRLIQS